MDVSSLRSKFLTRAQREKSVKVTVGYQAAYALVVHENPDAKHEPPTSFKYLERPAREMGQEIGIGIREDIAKGMSIRNALYRGGLKLQRASQQIVPVDTGNLKASAFTEVEEEET